MTTHAPTLIERVLRRLADVEVAEASWGDLLEEAASIEHSHGRTIARLWIALQSVRLIFGLVDRSVFAPGRWAGEVTMDEWSERRRRLVALVGVLAALPAALLVVSGLLFIFSGNRSTTQALDATLFDPDGFFFRVVLHPITVLGGLALALALNLIPLLRINIERGAETARATVALRLRRTHLGIAALGFGLFAIILGYAFTENFEVIPRTPAQAEAVDIPAAAAVGVGWTAVRRAGGHWDMRPILTWDASTYAAFVESCRSGGGFILESQPSSEPNGVVVPEPICWQREPNR